jgi:hypothetical protein
MVLISCFKDPPVRPNYPPRPPYRNYNWNLPNYKSNYGWIWITSKRGSSNYGYVDYTVISYLYSDTNYNFGGDTSLNLGTLQLNGITNLQILPENYGYSKDLWNYFKQTTYPRTSYKNDSILCEGLFGHTLNITAQGNSAKGIKPINLTVETSPEIYFVLDGWIHLVKSSYSVIHWTPQPSGPSYDDSVIVTLTQEVRDKSDKYIKTTKFIKKVPDLGLYAFSSTDLTEFNSNNWNNGQNKLTITRLANHFLLNKEDGKYYYVRIELSAELHPYIYK